jgi:hypothetical protein
VGGQQGAGTVVSISMLKGRETLDSPIEQVFPADLASRPRRQRGAAWSQFLKAPASGIIAFDLFTVETAILKTLYVLFSGVCL